MTTATTEETPDESGQIPREQLKTMTAKQIEDARHAGRLNNILGITSKENQ